MTELLSIAYVDEAKDERDNFFVDAYDSGLFKEIFLLHPESNIDELVNKLLDLQIDALVTDFNLSEAGPLNYNGEQLVSAFLAVRSDFPCFIRTSYDEDALASSDDVNRVYSKNVVHDESAGRYLFKRIAKQIEHYRQRVIGWQNELETLMNQAPESRNGEDVARILVLDSKIEASLGKDMAIPDHIKGGIFEKENQLISETELLISEIKRALGD